MVQIIQGLIPVRCIRFSSPPKRPVRSWDSVCLVYDACRSMELHLVLTSRMNGAVTPLPLCSFTVCTEIAMCYFYVSILYHPYCTWIPTVKLCNFQVFIQIFQMTTLFWRFMPCSDYTFSIWTNSITLKIEAARFFETSENLITTQCKISKDNPNFNFLNFSISASLYQK